MPPDSGRGQDFLLRANEAYRAELVGCIGSTRRRGAQK